MNLQDKGLTLLRQYLEEGCCVIAALSGGADSVVLTHLLLVHREALGIRLCACHLNHNLRGAESFRDQAFVQALCRQWDIPLFEKSVDIARLVSETGKSVEECARDERYRFFEECAVCCEKQEAVVKIATAHTLSDQVETVLFHLARGTGLRGLCGMPVQRGRIIRPLLGFTREEVEEYCREYQLRYVTDSTNSDTVYSRNKIRHLVVPVLREMNQNVEHSIENTVRAVCLDEEYLDQAAGRIYRESQQGQDSLALAPLQTEHPALRRRVILKFLASHKLEQSSYAVETIDRMVLQGHGNYNISKDRFVRAGQKILFVERAQQRCSYYEQALKEGTLESKTGNLYKIQTIDTFDLKIVNNIYKNLFDIFLDCGKIHGSVLIRQKKPGDRIKLLGRTHTKSIKKLLNEAKVPVDVRAQLFVVADDKGVIALEGFGVDERAACSASTTKSIHIKLLKGKNEHGTGYFEGTVDRGTACGKGTGTGRTDHGGLSG